MNKEYFAHETAIVDAEFMFSLKAFDDTYSQTVYARHSYKFNEVIWGAKFTPMFHSDEHSNATVLELDKIGVFENAELPLKLQKAASE